MAVEYASRPGALGGSVVGDTSAAAGAASRRGTTPTAPVAMTVTVARATRANMPQRYGAATVLSGTPALCSSASARGARSATRPAECLPQLGSTWTDPFGV